MKYLFIGSLIIIFSGCATISSIERNAKNINFSDGISRQEAKIIAKKQIIQTSFKNNYRIISPKVYDVSEFNNEEAEKELFITHVMSDSNLYSEGEFRYSDSWYVVFRPKFLSLFSTYYLVVIDKSSGQVQHTHEDNAIAALGQVFFWSIEEDMLQLQPATIAATYYTEKGHWPSEAEKLQEYFEGKVSPQDIKEEEVKINLKDFQFRQTQEGYLLIEKENKKGEVLSSELLYEIHPSGDNKFILYYKKAKIQESYILTTIEGKVKVYPNIQDKEGEYLINLFSPTNLKKIIDKKLSQIDTDINQTNKPK